MVRPASGEYVHISQCEPALPYAWLFMIPPVTRVFRRRSMMSRTMLYGCMAGIGPMFRPAKAVNVYTIWVFDMRGCFFRGLGIWVGSVVGLLSIPGDPGVGWPGFECVGRISL